MLLSLTCHSTDPPATDLGYLLHKNPERVNVTDLTFGKATIFYLDREPTRCTAILLVEVDPVSLVRRKSHSGFALEQYVNDRPYAASSFLSVAISQCFGTALNGRCQHRPELVDRKLPLELRIPVLPAPSETRLRALFEPLGYQVECHRVPLEPAFPAWGEGRSFEVRLTAEHTVAEALSHLYVLIPVLDRDKHYWVGEDEVEKLLAKGKTWLPRHPEKDWITTRYLRYQRRLIQDALSNLSTGEEPLESNRPDVLPVEEAETLHEQRLAAVLELLEAENVDSVIDLGCGEGKLLTRLLKQTRIPKIAGMDVSSRALEIAAERLKLRELPARQQERLQLFQGSLTYRDQRLAGYEAAAIVEVIEHLDLSRLEALERVVFGHAAPGQVLLTTPNRDYNVLLEKLPPGQLRHADHRFEWTRAEFRQWAERVGQQFGYDLTILPVGSEDPDHGAPSQLAHFRRQP